jgi:hypothetical protein
MAKLAESTKRLDAPEDVRCEVLPTSTPDAGHRLNRAVEILLAAAQRQEKEAA